MRDFSEKLEKFGISLASNQFEFSLVNRDAEADGTLAECKRLGKPNYVCFRKPEPTHRTKGLVRSSVQVFHTTKSTIRNECHLRYVSAGVLAGLLKVLCYV